MRNEGSILRFAAPDFEPQFAACQARYHLMCGSNPVSLDPLGGIIGTEMRTSCLISADRRQGPGVAIAAVLLMLVACTAAEPTLPTYSPSEGNPALLTADDIVVYQA